MKKYTYILVLFCLPIFIFSQEEIKIATKQYSESFKYKKSTSIEINGERADINVQGAEVEEITIEAKVVSKNSSRREAEEDLGNMNVLLEKIGKTIYIRNYISIKANEEKPSSNIKVIFEVKVPMGCDVVVNNSFGEVQLSNLNGNINVDTKYTKINMAYLGGLGKVKSLLGDVNIHSSFGEYKLIMNRADLLMENTDGSFDIESKYGAVQIAIKPELENLVVKGETVDVVLLVDDISASYYNLSSSNGKIQIDESLNLNHRISKNNEVQKIELNREIDCSKLDINTEFGTITLNKTSL